MSPGAPKVPSIDFQADSLRAAFAPEDFSSQKAQRLPVVGGEAGVSFGASTGGATGWLAAMIVRRSSFTAFSAFWFAELLPFLRTILPACASPASAAERSLIRGFLRRSGSRRVLSGFRSRFPRRAGRGPRWRPRFPPAPI